MKLTNNQEAKRYEWQIDEHLAFVEYILIKNEKIYLTHTEVPQQLSGKGIGSQLVKAVLDEVKKNNWELVPLCPFVALYISKNPTYKSLVLRGINIE